MMKPPEEVFPQRKAAEFDETGRPYHSFFYCGKPNFFKLLYDVVELSIECNKFEDRMIRQGKTADPALKIDFTGNQWLSKEHLELHLVETIRQVEYQNFVNSMTRLVDHPYSYRHKEFIDKFSRPMLDSSITLEIPKLQVDSDGRSFITVYGEFLRSKTTRKKRSFAC
jgi:small subunit ribosomal protein S9